MRAHRDQTAVQSRLQMPPLPAAQRRGRRLQSSGRFLDRVLAQRRLGGGQRVDVGELLRLARLHLCPSQGADAHDERGRQQRDRCGRGDRQRAVPPQELAGTVGKPVGRRQDGQAVEMAPDVFGQFVDRGVATLGVLPQRLEDDVIEITCQRLGQPRGRMLTPRGKGRILARRDAAGTRRLRLADHTGGGGRHERGHLVG